jgi:signal transduction histidine kinase
MDWNLKTDRIESGRPWKSQLGYADDELADTLSAWRGRVRVADLGRQESAIAAHARSKSPFFQVECRLRTQAGGWKWLRLKGMVASRDADTEPTRIFLMQQDITELKHTEALPLQAQVFAVSTSPAQISHEIPSPMDGILGMTELGFDSAPLHYLKTGPATEGVLHQDGGDSLIDGIVNFRNRLDNKSGNYYMEQLHLLRVWLNTHIARSDKSWSPFCAGRTIKK